LRTIRYSTWAVTSGLTARDDDRGSDVTDMGVRLLLVPGIDPHAGVNFQPLATSS
jgi:hypothetical protein